MGPSRPAVDLVPHPLLPEVAGEERQSEPEHHEVVEQLQCQDERHPVLDVRHDHQRLLENHLQLVPVVLQFIQSTFLLRQSPTDPVEPPLS